MHSLFSQLMIVFKGFFVVACSQTFEKPNIQWFGVRQYIDASIDSVISLFKINHLCKVSICLYRYQNMLNSFNFSPYNTALALFKVYRWLYSKFIKQRWSKKTVVVNSSSGLAVFFW